VLSEVNRNLRIVLSEKSHKITPVRGKYPEWWLALVDYIGHGLCAGEREQLRALVTVEEPWDRVVLVNPLEPSQGFEL